ncbi:MAG: hypothetical protein K2K66_01715, partial [Ruminococcus sp.]|nr:hypothetical protein [Ruminococcus sp.]
MDYLTVAEMAELKGCSISYISRLIKTSKIPAEFTLNSETNKMHSLIPVSALSEDLQAKYYAKLRKDTGLAPELIEDKPEKLTKTKKLSRSFEELSADERKRLNFWCGLLQEWQGRRSQYKSKTEFDKNFVGECRLKYDDIEISERILYRKWTAYKNDDFDGILGVRGAWNRNNNT